MNTSRNIDEERSRASGRLVHLPIGTVYVEEEGPLEGEPVILVHGIAASTVVWELFFQSLVQRGYRVISYDLYGRGLSDRSSRPHHPALFREQLLGLLEALKVERPITLVGLSMGGLVAADFAGHYPDRIRRLALVAPAGVPNFRPWWFKIGLSKGLGELVMVTAGRRILPKLMERSFASDVAARRWLPRLMPLSLLPGYRRSILSSMRHMPLSAGMEIFEQLGACALRVGLFWGDQDTICPYDNHKAVLQAIPGTVLYTVEGGGHALHLDCAEQFEQAFFHFLDC